MKKYKCSECGLEVDKIPKFKKGECPNGIQHYFRKIERRKTNVLEKEKS